MTGEHIYYAAAYLVEALIAWSYGSYLFSEKQTKRLTVLLFSDGYAVLYLLGFYHNFLVNSGGFLLVNFLLLYFCFTIGKKTALLHAAYLTAAMGAAEILVAFGLNLLAHDYTAYTYNVSVLVALIVLSKIAYLLLSLIGRFLFRPHKEHKQEPGMILPLCALPLISTLLTAVIAYIGMTANLDGLLQVLIAVCLLGLLLANIWVLITYNKIEQVYQEKFSMELTLQKEKADACYYAMLQNQMEQQRILIHDTKNHLMAVKGMEAKLIEKKGSYYDD